MRANNTLYLKMLMGVLLMSLYAVVALAENPKFSWAISTSGTNNLSVKAQTTDQNGNSYLAGTFIGIVSLDKLSLISNRDWDTRFTYDGFIAKIDNQGNWKWAIRLGNEGREAVTSISVDAKGYIYISGDFTLDFFIGNSPLINKGVTNHFVASLDAQGAWIKAISISSNALLSISNCMPDSAGNLYLAGNFTGSIYFGSVFLSSTYGSESDIFIAKLNHKLNWLWATRAGGYDTNEIITDLVVRPDGNLVLLGNYSNTVSFGTISLFPIGGSSDIFVAEIDGKGKWIQAVNAGGQNTDLGGAISLHDHKQLCITGSFQGSANWGSIILYNNTNTTNQSVFVAVLDSLYQWQWAATVNSDGNTWGTGIASRNGNIYVTGNFDDNMNWDTRMLNNKGKADIFVACYDINRHNAWARDLGSAGDEQALWLQTDRTGNLYLGGLFEGAIQADNQYLNSFGITDSFLCRICLD